MTMQTIITTIVVCAILLACKKATQFALLWFSYRRCRRILIKNGYDPNDESFPKSMAAMAALEIEFVEEQGRLTRRKRRRRATPSFLSLHCTCFSSKKTLGEHFDERSTPDTVGGYSTG